MKSLLNTGIACFLIFASGSANAASAEAGKPAVQTKPRLRMHIVRKRGQHEGYTVSVRYPQFSGSPEALVKQLNDDIRHHVDMYVPATAGPTGFESRYSCDFKGAFVTPEIVSILFCFEDDLRGAHPGLRSAAFNRQVWPQYRTLQLSDVVRRPVNYKYLGSLCESQTKKEDAEQTSMVALCCTKQDLAPSDFANFTCNKKAIRFTFPTGRFGPPCELTDAAIEYNLLKRVVPSTSPLYRYTRGN